MPIDTAALEAFSFLGNTGLDYGRAVLVFASVILALLLFKIIILARVKEIAKKSKSDFDDLLVRLIDEVHWPFYFVVGAYFALGSINLSESVQRWIGYTVLIAAAYYAVRTINSMVWYFTSRLVEKRQKQEKGGDAVLAYLLGKIINVIVWVIALLFVLSNFGINVTSALAGLGIGGIAIALALQNILGDIFSAFSLYFDKPFEVGDFIIVGEHLGTVKHVGIKSTRITALGGEEIIISNRELTSTRVRNFKKMERRRIVFSFGIVYQTPAKKVEKIPSIVKKIIESVEQTEFNRAHFKAFGASSLDFEVVYYMLVADYNQYMDVQQEINLKLVKAFEKESIEFAYPTQTLYVNKG